MKIRNFAFFGVMAAIFATANANADPNPAKRIASTNYVDNAVAPKEDTANKKELGEATWSTITDKNSDTKFPTMAVLNEAVTSASSGASGAIAALDAHVQATNNYVVTGVTQADGAITAVDEAKVSEAMLDTTLGGKVTSYDTHIANDNIHVTTADKTNWNGKEDTANKKELGEATWSTITDKNSDTKFPTMAVLNEAVTSASSGASGAIAALDAHVQATNNYVVTGVTQADGAITAVDEAKVSEAMLDTTLATKINGKADSATTLAGYGITDAYTKTEVDTTTGDLSNLSGAAASASNLVSAINAVASQSGTALQDVTYPIVNISGANALANIDGTASSAQDTNCTENDPCVLTYYYKDGAKQYRWSTIEGLPTE